MIQEQVIKFSDHLEELRRRLIISGLSIALFAAISFVLSDILMEIISAPIAKRIHALYFFSPYEAFMIKFKVSFVSGTVLSAPVIFTQLWRFVSPGLYSREQRAIRPLIIFSTLLFGCGVLFAYFVVIPTALTFFLDFEASGLHPLISISSYLSFFLSFVLTFGLMFVLPLILVGLISLRVVNASVLSCQRKFVIVLIFILAAVLTPTADILTQFLLAIPLWALFEISVWIGRRIERERVSR